MSVTARLLPALLWLPRWVRRRTRGAPAVGFVVVYCAFLLLLPSQLVLTHTGAPGTPANLGGIGLLLWWTCLTLSGGGRGYSPAKLGIGLLVLCVLLSYASGVASGWWAPLGVRESTSDIFLLTPPQDVKVHASMTTAGVRGIINMASWAGVVLMITDGLRSWRDLATLVAWLSWLGGLVAGIGIIQFFTQLNIAEFFQIPGLVANSDFGTVQARSVLNRVSATATHPIEFGVVLAALFPIALHYALSGAHGRRGLVPAVLIGVAVPMAVSRSAVLTLAVGFLVLMLGWPNKRRIWALLLAPVSVVALRIMVPGLVGTIRSLFANAGGDPSISGRTDDYDIVFRVIGHHPIFGRGLATFIPYYYRILDNQYLGLLVELGICGLAATLLFLVLSYFSARGARLRATSARAKDLALSLSASLAALSLAYATFDAWSFPMAAGITFVLAGMAGAAWRIAVRQQQMRERAAPSRAERFGARHQEV